MPKMTFINPDGTRKEVDAPVGLSVLEIAHRNGIDLEGACEGSLACSTCHLDTGQGRGPSLKDIVGTTVELADGSSTKVDEAYLRESILTPQTHTVAGYQQLMPTFQGLVNEQSVASLIEYIKTMQSGPAAPPVVAAQAP